MRIVSLMSAFTVLVTTMVACGGTDGAEDAELDTGDIASEDSDLTKPPLACGSLYPYECPTGYFCEHTGSQCGGPGRCLPATPSCPLINYPVCGCDGQTYPNPCVAHLKGTSVAHSGKCK